MSEHFRAHSTENYQLDLIRMLVNWAEVPDDPHGPEMRNLLARRRGSNPGAQGEVGIRLVLQSHLGKVSTGPVVALTGPVLVAAAPF